MLEFLKPLLPNAKKPVANTSQYKGVEHKDAIAHNERLRQKRLQEFYEKEAEERAARNARLEKEWADRDAAATMDRGVFTRQIAKQEVAKQREREANMARLYEPIIPAPTTEDERAEVITKVRDGIRHVTGQENGIYRRTLAELAGKTGITAKEIQWWLDEAIELSDEQISLLSQFAFSDGSLNPDLAFVRFTRSAEGGGM